MKELTELQKMWLQLTADGHKISSILRQMHIAPSTHEEYSYEVRRKLEAKSLAHAVAIGIRKGIIK